MRKKIWHLRTPDVSSQYLHRHTVEIAHQVTTSARTLEPFPPHRSGRDSRMVTQFSMLRVCTTYVLPAATGVVSSSKWLIPAWPAENGVKSFTLGVHFSPLSQTVKQ